MVAAGNLDWILRTLDGGGRAPGWSLRVVKETYYLSREDGAVWVKKAGQVHWKVEKGPKEPKA